MGDGAGGGTGAEGGTGGMGVTGACGACGAAAAGAVGSSTETPKSVAMPDSPFAYPWPTARTFQAPLRK